MRSPHAPLDVPPGFDWYGSGTSRVTMTQAPDLAESFRRFSDPMAHSLPLYSVICAGAAEDPEVRDLLLHTPREQRQPILLLAVVHHLLLSGVEHALAQRYPTLGGQADLPGDPYPEFRDLVLGHRDEVVQLLETRNTQTNEIGRCAILRPCWAAVTEDVDQPLGLVELGSSAGLNLLLDRWAYRYLPDGPRYGDPEHDVLVESESRGAAVPTIGPANIGSRVGIDLRPIPILDNEAVRWLLACIWPENISRFRRLQRAIEVARASPPRLITGDLVETLPLVAAEVPAEQHLAVQNSWVLNYLPADERTRLKAVVAELGHERDLSWVSAESPEFAPGLDYPPRPDGTDNRQVTVAVLTTWRSGEQEVRRLADCHPHGTWIRWW